MSLITPQDEQLFRSRYRGPTRETSLEYARTLADEYAMRHASDMPYFVQAGVAALHFRHVYIVDSGERQLLRAGIDLLLAIGKGCRHADATH